jgi:hypothetical protein
MMTTQRSLYLGSETEAKLKELAALWSQAKPLPISAVVRECVRRVHETETKTKTSTKTKGRR